MFFACGVCLFHFTNSSLPPLESKMDVPPAKKARTEAPVPSKPLAIWQYKDVSTKAWVSFPQADIDYLEKEFAANGSAKVSSMATTFLPGQVVLFDMATWACKTPDGAERPIRRLQNGVWEWKDDSDLFVPFYDEDNAMIETNWRACTTEAQFSTTALSFNVGFGSKYTFKFSSVNDKGEVEGVQRNEDSGKERKIRRTQPDPSSLVWDRKNYGISAATPPPPPPAVSDPGTTVVSTSIFDPPSYWQPQTAPYETFVVPPDCTEFNDVVKPFMNTLHQPCKIHWVKRLQNQILWKFYALCRYRVACRNKGDANEMKLFHGARMRENMDAISEFGFDMRVARDGSAGIGIYFAVNSQYSNSGYVLRNPDNSREIFVCRAAIGSTTKGKHGLKRPPPKTGKKAAAGDLFDSVHNGVNVMYVVFDNSQAYPEYVIKYTPAQKF